MAGLLVEMELKQAGLVQFTVNSEHEKALLQSGIHPLDFLEQTGRTDIERRAAVNHVCAALYADMLHFIYEGLIALEKRKFSVAFALFRKPFKEGLLIAAQMCSDEEVFFNLLKYNVNDLLDRKTLDETKIKQLINSTIETCHWPELSIADNIYEYVFNRRNDDGLGSLFDKATHLVTEFKHIRTEDYNINFIFKNPNDNDVFEGNTYLQLATLLLFLHLMQIELYSRMGHANKKYMNWMAFTSIGTFETLFATGRSSMIKFINTHMKDFLVCPFCESNIKIKKSKAPRLFIAEMIECDDCHMEHHFPIGWLLSKADIDLFNT